MYLLMMFFPLISALVTLTFGSFLGIKGVNLFSCFCLGSNVVISCFMYYDIMVCNSIILMNLWDWVSFNVFETNMSFFMDSLSGGMIFVVNMVSFLVHVYSTSYMKGDPHTPSFMGYLSLFTFFMLILVSSQNYLQLFIGWEGVGLSSYLLMNYWFGSIQANKAAMKAMLMNSVGDAALMAAMILIWLNYGNVSFFNTFSSHSTVVDTMIPILLLVGAVGKSAQMGLHTWLPDAMEGPTPVSALMHAATMVTAGVYLIISSSSIFEASPTSLIITVLIGGLTALFAATVGLAQNDIKKMMAYSTCSQLGFMVLSCGISYYSLSLFHLMNHAFFKALLFLSAGSMMHALSDEQDMSKMGGTNLVLPLSYVFMLMGSLSLAGTPFLAGYYSKDLLLELSTKQYYIIIGAWLGLAATLLTAFYSFKLISSTFMMFQNSPSVYWSTMHESEFNMLWPLFVLATGSVFSGFLLKDLMLGPVMHPNILVVIKFTPLILSMLGALVALSLFILSKNYWLLFFSVSMKKLYGFLSSAWGFDKIMSTFIVKPMWFFGYNMSFKLFDSGFIEMFGPFGLGKKIMLTTQKVSSIQSGLLFNYALFILMGASIYIMLN